MSGRKELPPDWFCEGQEDLLNLLNPLDQPDQSEPVQEGEADDPQRTGS